MGGRRPVTKVHPLEDWRVTLTSALGVQQRRHTRRMGPAGSAVALRNCHVLIPGPCDRLPYTAKGTADVINSKDYEREEHSGISRWTHFHRMHP